MDLPVSISNSVNDFQGEEYKVIGMGQFKYVIIKPSNGCGIWLDSLNKENGNINIEYKSMFIDEACISEFIILKIDNHKGEVLVTASD